jgi:hypothetical protein
MAAYYRIQIASHLGTQWSSWFADLEIRNNEDGTTTMQGVLPDQPALWGVLARIQSAGLTLLALERISEPAARDERPDRTTGPSLAPRAAAARAPEVA